MHRDSVLEPICTALALLGCTLLAVAPLAASSHREAPGILSMPQVDGTDFYMFRSYEPGRAGFVTLIANYNPLQDPYGGPNYFPLDPDAFYDIHITNNGDAEEDLTFRFRFRQNSPFIALDIGAHRDPEGTFRAGDYQLYPEGSTHAPRVDPGSPGWVVARLGGRVRFTGIRGLAVALWRRTRALRRTVASKPSN